MAIAQGISKITVFKKQAGLGTPASGTGGQIMRRESSANVLKKDTYANNEIVSHQQSTGKTHGLRSVDIALNGVLSPGTYASSIGSILRRDFTALTAITAVSVTIAGTAPTWTVTRAAGSYLTDGFKIGHVIRLTVGTLNVLNLNKNLLITGLTATVATVRVLNETNMFAEGPITGTTITAVGKQTFAPLTGHTRDYYTVEDWQSDITQSELFTDVILGMADFNLPSTGNATINLAGPGLNRSSGAVQILTTPTAETTSNVMAAVNGDLIVNGVVMANVTGLSIKIDGKAANMGAVVGSNVSPDVQRGIIEVTGQFTAFYQDGVLPGLFDAATQISLVFAITADSSATSEFMSIVIPNITLDGDSKDDGDKAIVRTFPFTARLNAAGGTGTNTEKSIIVIQDSLA
jgi:Phage tail tube protein